MAEAAIATAAAVVLVGAAIAVAAAVAVAVEIGAAAAPGPVAVVGEAPAADFSASDQAGTTCQPSPKKQSLGCFFAF